MRWYMEKNIDKEIEIDYWNFCKYILHLVLSVMWLGNDYWNSVTQINFKFYKQFSLNHSKFCWINQNLYKSTKYFCLYKKKSLLEFVKFLLWMYVKALVEKDSLNEFRLKFLKISGDLSDLQIHLHTRSIIEEILTLRSLNSGNPQIKKTRAVRTILVMVYRVKENTT